MKYCFHAIDIYLRKNKREKKMKDDQRMDRKQTQLDSDLIDVSLM
jgi:hypothetical protein